MKPQYFWYTTLDCYRFKPVTSDLLIWMVNELNPGKLNEPDLAAERRKSLSPLRG